MTTSTAPQTRSRHNLLSTIAITVWSIIITVIVIRLLRHPADKNSIFKLLYDTGASWLNQQHLYADEGAYRYSPGVAALLSLFARLPIRVATLLWLATSLAAFWAGLLYWMRVALPTTRDRGYHAVLILIATPLVLGNFNNLQANPICLGAMLALVAATLRKQWLIAALCITLCAMFKVYPLAIAFVLLVLFPRRLWLAMIVGLALAAALPFVFQQPDYVVRCYHEWVDSVIKDQRFDRPLATSYRDAALLWRAYIGPLNAQAYQIITLAAAACIGIIAFLLRFSKRHDRTRAHFLLALVLCWVMLLGPSTESATYMMFGPLIAWLVLESFTGRWHLLLKLLSVLSYLILLSVVIAIAVTPWGRQYLSHGPQPLAALLALIPTITWFAQKLATEFLHAFPVSPTE